jgi:hydrogenase maturation protein HypF
MTTRARVLVDGVVQGVGFRPFVHGLAQRLSLGGVVGNDSDGVFIEVEGPAEAVDTFVDLLRTESPPLAVVERVRVEHMPPTGTAGFTIVDSAGNGERRALVSPDMATCDDCLAEVLHPGDRRHRYPFTNCTNCGPRFTIVTGVPYDRSATTMAGFAMCELCRREYEDPSDRRFHAQPVCCPACGPTLRLVGDDGDAIGAAADRLRAGQVLAVKGLGGYHLAALASNEPAAAALRARKHREDKPFAVMAADLDAASRLVAMDDGEASLLSSARRPVVLLERRPDAPVAASVAPGNRRLGVMLPYTALHHLLARELGEPFVLTSGNVSDEPIAYRDDDAVHRLAGIADAFLTHDRPIHIRTDDSVTRVFRGRELVLRRSRGYAPRPVRLPRPLARPVLACGAELKHTFCLAKGEHAFVSHHIGDLENYETMRSFTEGVEHFERLFDIHAEVVAHDLHPEYLSTKYALDLADAELIGVQHHHAHIASCLADNGETGPVIGVAFDGLGYGADGSLWGGEILVADLHGFQRVGHLSSVPMPGGTAAIREPWRMAAAWLNSAFDGEIPAGLSVVARHADRWGDVLAVAGAATAVAPSTSSAGRLFDAVAAIAGVRDRINYEGQAAVELEQLADRTVTDGYPMATGGSPQVLDGGSLVRAVTADVLAGVGADVVAARFHNGLGDGVVRACELARDATGEGTVALSGGVFQNLLLLERVVAGLEAHGFRVLLHSQVPPNDGGISLGQAAVAAARMS